MRAPKVDPAWNERGRLYLALLERAAADPAVLQSQARASAALDALFDANADHVATALVAFLRRLRATVRAYLAAEPVLAEVAYPAARIHAGEERIPPQLTYFLAPLASLGVVGHTVLRHLLERRIERDDSWFAKEVLKELQRQAAFADPVLRHERPLAELQRAISITRGRGRPPGRSRSGAGWSDVPETFDALLALVRPAVDNLRRDSARVTITTVAARLGMDERRLREAFEHYGYRGAALFRQVQRENRERPR